MTDQPAAVDLEFERGALGCLLLGESVLDALMDGLTSQDFYREAHRHIWEAAVELEQRGVRADFSSVAEELRRRGQYDNPAYFWKLTDGSGRPDEKGRKHFVKRLRELSSCRRLMAMLTEAVDELSSGRDTADKAGDLIARIEAERSNQTTDRRQYDGMGQVEVMLAELTRDKGEAVTWGFPGLDRQVPGIYPGEVFGLMARPGIGKTLLLNHMTRHCAPLGHVFFSLEMPAAQIAARMARSVFGYTRSQLESAARDATLDTAQYLQAAEGLTLVDAPGLSVAQMDGMIRQLKTGAMRGTPVRLVTVDHLGLIGGDRTLSTYDRVSTQARELKELAKRHLVAVLVAIQVNREQGGDGSRELSLGAARDSGVVEEAVDYLVALRRLDRSRDASMETRDKYRDVVFAKVLKNRHGVIGDEIAVRLNGEDLTLCEDPSVRAEESDLKNLYSGGKGRR
ncbi:MAG TPA: DnaB-like helicase C-terminal domain-containing protein [Phycisphaerae bacterium]|nr:DnaB-like helicase C-terminal domain-containing protein [Phycisphaerae bacterium]